MKWTAPPKEGWWWCLIRFNTGWEVYDRWHVAKIANLEDLTVWHFWDGFGHGMFSADECGENSAEQEILEWRKLKEPEEPGAPQ